LVGGVAEIWKIGGGGWRKVEDDVRWVEKGERRWKTVRGASAATSSEPSSGPYFSNPIS